MKSEYVMVKYFLQSTQKMWRRQKPLSEGLFLPPVCNCSLYKSRGKPITAQWSLLYSQFYLLYTIWVTSQIIFLKVLLVWCQECRAEINKFHYEKLKDNKQRIELICIVQNCPETSASFEWCSGIIYGITCKGAWIIFQWIFGLKKDLLMDQLLEW